MRCVQGGISRNDFHWRRRTSKEENRQPSPHLFQLRVESGLSCPYGWLSISLFYPHFENPQGATICRVWTVWPSYWRERQNLHTGHGYKSYKVPPLWRDPWEEIWLLPLLRCETIEMKIILHLTKIPQPAEGARARDLIKKPPPRWRWLSSLFIISNTFNLKPINIHGAPSSLLSLRSTFHPVHKVHGHHRQWPYIGKFLPWKSPPFSGLPQKHFKTILIL